MKNFKSSLGTGSYQLDDEEIHWTINLLICLKKILKITGISLLVIIIALAAVPFLFKDKIKELGLSFKQNNG